MSPGFDTETLLANAFEDLLSISAIAADLADDEAQTLAPVRLRSSRKPLFSVYLITPELKVLGLLRNPAGAAPSPQ